MKPITSLFLTVTSFLLLSACNVDPASLDGATPSDASGSLTGDTVADQKTDGESSIKEEIESRIEEQLSKEVVISGFEGKELIQRNFPVTATASQSGQRIAEVEFFINKELIRIEKNPPLSLAGDAGPQNIFEFDFLALGSGEHLLEVRALLEDGSEALTEKRFTVLAPTEEEAPQDVNERQSDRLASDVKIEKVRVVKRHAITWTFAEEVEVARYVNGDYAVITPAEGVVVRSVSPAPSNGRDGSGVNVGRREQPADERSAYYIGSISYPHRFYPGDALLSFRSKTKSDEDCEGAGGADILNVMNYCARTNVTDASVLMFVSEAPQRNEFRPAALGDSSNRRRYILPALETIVDQLPAYSVSQSEKYDIQELIQSKERFQFEAIDNWQRRSSAPANNQSSYAAYSTNPEALLALAADYPREAKRRLLIAVIQHGIELEGASRIGARFVGADGGHGTHQLSVMAVTSELLGDTNYTNYVRGLTGSEKEFTYFGRNGLALWGKVCGSPEYFRNYCVENDYQGGPRDCRDPEGRRDELNKPSGIKTCVGYQTLNGKYYAGQALAMGLLGAVDDFNHPAFFAYTDRWMNERNLQATTDFTRAMWRLHREKIDF